MRAASALALDRFVGIVAHFSRKDVGQEPVESAVAVVGESGRFARKRAIRVAF